MQNCCCWSLLYSAILRPWADSLCSHVILHEWIAFYSVFLNIHRSDVLVLQCWHGWCHMQLLSSWHILCTPYNHTPCHFMQSHILKVHAYLAATGHLHFGQNDRGFLCATAVTRGWNGYQNKSQHRKLSLEKKISPPPPTPHCRDSNPWLFNHESSTLTTELSPFSKVMK